MPDVSFSNFVTGLPVDTLLTGPEKIPIVEGTASSHITATLLAAFVVDSLHQAQVVSTLNDNDEINVFQSDVEKILTVQNFFNWVVDKLEALPTETTIVDGDKLVFNDGGVLKQIDIATVRTFLNSTDVALGAQINGLTAASTPLNLTDQFVLAQGSTALKTTLQVIRDQVYTDYLAYVSGLPAVPASGANTLADADTFYVNDNGVASKVTAQTIAAYVQAEVGAAIVSDAWTNYAALGGSANATDVFLLRRGVDGKTATGANLASYVVSTMNDASHVSPALATDHLVAFRSGTQRKMDVSVLSTQVLASGWSATSLTPVLTTDKIIFGRGGTTYSVTVDDLKTCVLTGIQGTVLNLTGLTDIGVGLDATDLFLVGEGATAKKATLTQIETKLWSDYQTYVSGLTSLTSLEDADLFYVIEGTTPKKITGANIASYMETEMWDKSAASPVLVGDTFWMRRSGVSYTATAGALATYVGSVVTSNIDVTALSDTSYPDSGHFLIDQGLNENRKVSLLNLRTHFYTQFVTHVNGLTASTSPVDASVLYIIDGVSARKTTVGDLWDNRYLADAKAIKLDDFATPDDNTDLNATPTYHGLLPKLSNNARQFFRGDGAYATYASITATPVAATGSNAGDAAPLATTNTTYITCDSAIKGVKLPNAAAGDIMEILNNSATAAKLYPATSGFLNGQAANAAVVIPASKGVRCFCSAADTWTVFEMAAKAANA